MRRYRSAGNLSIRSYCIAQLAGCISSAIIYARDFKLGGLIVTRVFVARAVMPIVMIASALAIASPVSAVQLENRGVVVGKSGKAITALASRSDEAGCTRAGMQVVTMGTQKFCGAPLDAAGQGQCTRSGGKVVMLSGQPFCETEAARAPKPPTQGQ